ncbi:hypothetical protein [Emticicia sp. BO119]|uniref:hypothetical protein n=1 Tax=Emticicia sp. BO119 TaxID=2757768 RepID=UPI0015EFFFCD|nr:hypothetical protein [Emticicia sp. BO119]MBA4849039.1 hypothetical protein [Emticicia sp. BO119]
MNKFKCKLIFSIPIIFIFLNSCYNNYPEIEDVAVGDSLSIDGEWECDSSTADFPRIPFTVIISKGRLWTTHDNLAIKAGSIFVKNIRQDKTNKNLFYGTRISLGWFQIRHEKSTTFHLKDNTLIEDAVFVPSLNNSEIYLTKYRRVDTEETPVDKKNCDSILVDIISENRKVSDVQHQFVAPGSKLKIERQRTISHVVNLEKSITDTKSNGNSSEIGFGIPLGGTLKKSIETKITSQVEELIGHELSTTETYNVSLELDGNKGSKWSIIWYDKIRSGVVTYFDENCNKTKVPFSIVISSEIEAKHYEK